MIQRHPCNLITLLAASLAGGSGARAQSVGPGEQRFNQGAYKASFTDNDADVIDAFNCWFVEFRIGTDGFNIWTLYTFCDQRQLLLLELEDLAESVDASQRVTVVDLKLAITTEDCWTAWPAPEIYRRDIQNLCENAFGAPRIYTSQEFKNVDGSSWPSYQELVRRGRNWVIILDEELTGYADDDFFFGMARRGAFSDGPPTEFEPNSVLIYSGHYNLADWTTFPDRWLYYSHFYTAACCGDPFRDDQGTFEDDIARGNNFIGTYCLNEEYTMEPPIHSPAPVHVVRDPAPTAQFGTIYRPFREEAGLLAAMERASPKVPIQIEAAAYEFPAGTVFDLPAVLTTAGGIVRLQ